MLSHFFSISHRFFYHEKYINTQEKCADRLEIYQVNTYRIDEKAEINGISITLFVLFFFVRLKIKQQYLLESVGSTFLWHYLIDFQHVDVGIVFRQWGILYWIRLFKIEAKNSFSSDAIMILAAVQNSITTQNSTFAMINNYFTWNIKRLFCLV